MADHLDAPGLQSPNMNARTDITDIYAFQKPGNKNKSILILNVNPLAPTLAKEFDHTAIYELKIDTNGDAVEDITYRFKFSKFEEGEQFFAMRRAVGNAARQMRNTGELIFDNVAVSFGRGTHIEEQDEYRIFAGIRSDPFFFDLLGFLNGFNFTGSDFFIDKNVFSIALEVPNRALGRNPKIGIWARVLLPQPGTPTSASDDDEDDNDDDDRRPRRTYFQVDRMGRPAINTVFNKGEDKNLFNHTVPSQDRELFTKNVVKVLESFGYNESEATGIANILLPDILTYDYSSSAGFLNGRKLTDDVIDIELALVSKGAVTTDKVGSHTDLIPNFPYMGRPH